MDDDSFKARVHKVFGSLPAPASAPEIDPAWTLTGEEVEKKEWNRSKLKSGQDDDDQTLCSSSYDGLFKHSRSNQRRNVISGLENDDVEDLNNEDGSGSVGDEVWEIRSSIGLDSTLDNEEEEDEFDRVAEGMDNASDRLYMKTIVDREASSDPSGLSIGRDPRANHLAAQARLKEDTTAEKYETHSDGITPCNEQHLTEVLQDHPKVKPILKRTRKPESGGLKSVKRVRFDPSCKEECEEASELEPSWAVPASTKSNSQENESILDISKPKVPDHVLNPSKYTCYSLDSTSVLDDESNSRACGLLLEEVKKWRHDQLARESMDVSGNNPRSVTFVPRQKNINAIAAKDATQAKGVSEDPCNGSLHPKVVPVGVAAEEEAQQSEDPMEEDTETNMADNNKIVFHKPERHYRSKSGMEDSVC